MTKQTNNETTLESRVLRRACDLLGGEKAVTKYLQVPSAELQAWLRGVEVPPRHVFLRAVDLLLERSDHHAATTITAAISRGKAKRAA
jgi:hypothetical protein